MGRATIRKTAWTNVIAKAWGTYVAGLAENTRSRRYNGLSMKRHLHIGVLAVTLLSGMGCIGIPLTEHPLTRSHEDVRYLVGAADSGRPFRIGVTTREKVIECLGEPRWHTPQHRAFGYSFRVNAIRWISPFVGEPAIFPLIHRYTPAYYFLFLELDASGFLKRSVWYRREGFTDLGEATLWAQFTKGIDDLPVPPKEEPPVD